MNYAIWEPSKDVENRMFMGGEDIGQIGAIQDIFKSGQYAHPNMGSILIGNKSRSRVS